MTGSAGEQLAASSVVAPCTRTDTQPALAVIGIFTVNAHNVHRQVIRSTWLSTARANATALAFPFVLVGRGASDEVIAEAALYRDSVFVEAPAGLSYRAGQLRKTWAWLRCAATAWPEATLVGKADDDTWIDVVGVERHLRTSLQLASRLSYRFPRAGLYWGAFETYHWHLQRHRPLGHKFGYAHFEAKGKGGGEDCLRRAQPPRMRSIISRSKDEIGYGELKALPGAVPAQLMNASDVMVAASNRSSALALPVVGPFHFAKGPLYCLSAPLARALVADPWLNAYAEAAMGAPIQPTEVMWPFEDVFVGLGLAHIASRSHVGGGPLVSVDMAESGAQFIEAPGIFVGRATLVWHMKTKTPSRIAVVDRWRRRHRCQRNPATMRLKCLPLYAACGGTRWHRCYSYYPGHAGLNRNCSTKAENLRWPNFTIKMF